MWLLKKLIGTSELLSHGISIYLWFIFWGPKSVILQIYRHRQFWNVLHIATNDFAHFALSTQEKSGQKLAVRPIWETNIPGLPPHTKSTPSIPLAVSDTEASKLQRSKSNLSVVSEDQAARRAGRKDGENLYVVLRVACSSSILIVLLVFYFQGMAWGMPGNPSRSLTRVMEAFFAWATEPKQVRPCQTHFMRN